MSANEVLHPHVCSVSLSRGALCEDCKEIAVPVNDACAICGSKSILLVAGVLDRESRKVTWFGMDLNSAEAQKGETHG